ncbi:hypothetical protein TELCIR_15656 [Teladorsagia circumcincta]|uniref:Uncharacterized protein n=1 Tax=Teladorsagia circumcincta TaxID=45464 RepID=A0A2G9TZ94_TELCI|nr:hypothetical protein TELCIR_15656 [Teladorsagia circumcincta]
MRWSPTAFRMANALTDTCADEHCDFGAFLMDTIAAILAGCWMSRGCYELSDDNFAMIASRSFLWLQSGRRS